MAHLIDKDAILAEIESLLDKGKYHEEYDCAYRDGNNGALYALKGRINTLEVKEVDFDAEWERYFEHRGEMATVNVKHLAKHFFELGMRVNNPTTAADRGIAEEIIINLKRVENDYRINLTREITWVRNKAQKGEKYDR